MISEIPVLIDTATTRPVPSMNVEPILHEVRHALQRLLYTGESTSIDLRAMPLAPGEDEELRERLGTGEVKIEINALGPSHIIETAYPGVWWVEHRNINEQVTGLYIEITGMPSIVLPEQESMREALEQLTQHLSGND